MPRHPLLSRGAKDLLQGNTRLGFRPLGISNEQDPIHFLLKQLPQPKPMVSLNSTQTTKTKTPCGATQVTPRASFVFKFQSLLCP